MNRQNPTTETPVERKVVPTPFGERNVQVPKDLQKHEREMKNYFEGIEDPKAQNPNIQKASDAREQFRSQIKGLLDFKRMWYGLLAYEPTLEAEKDVMAHLIKTHRKMQYVYSGGFCLLYGSMALVKRHTISPGNMLGGLAMSYLLGVILAKLKANEYAFLLIPK